eukprot:g15283.t1
MATSTLIENLAANPAAAAALLVERLRSNAPEDGLRQLRNNIKDGGELKLLHDYLTLSPHCEELFRLLDRKNLHERIPGDSEEHRRELTVALVVDLFSAVLLLFGPRWGGARAGLHRAELGNICLRLLEPELVKVWGLTGLSASSGTKHQGAPPGEVKEIRVAGVLRLLCALACFGRGMAEKVCSTVMPVLEEGRRFSSAVRRFSRQATGGAAARFPTAVGATGAIFNLHGNSVPKLYSDFLRILFDYEDTDISAAILKNKNWGHCFHLLFFSEEHETATRENKTSLFVNLGALFADVGGWLNSMERALLCPLSLPRVGKLVFLNAAAVKVLAANLWKGGSNLWNGGRGGGASSFGFDNTGSRRVERVGDNFYTPSAPSEVVEVDERVDSLLLRILTRFCCDRVLFRGERDVQTLLQITCDLAKIMQTRPHARTLLVSILEAHGATFTASWLQKIQFEPCQAGFWKELFSRWSCAPTTTGGYSCEDDGQHGNNNKLHLMSLPTGLTKKALLQALWSQDKSVVLETLALIEVLLATVLPRVIRGTQLRNNKQLRFSERENKVSFSEKSDEFAEELLSTVPDSQVVLSICSWCLRYGESGFVDLLKTSSVADDEDDQLELHVSNSAARPPSQTSCAGDHGLPAEAAGGSGGGSSCNDATRGGGGHQAVAFQKAGQEHQSPTAESPTPDDESGLLWEQWCRTVAAYLKLNEVTGNRFSGEKTTNFSFAKLLTAAPANGDEATTGPRTRAGSSAQELKPRSDHAILFGASERKIRAYLDLVQADVRANLLASTSSAMPSSRSATGLKFKKSGAFAFVDALLRLLVREGGGGGKYLRETLFRMLCVREELGVLFGGNLLEVQIAYYCFFSNAVVRRDIHDLGHASDATTGDAHRTTTSTTVTFLRSLFVRLLEEAETIARNMNTDEWEDEVSPFLRAVCQRIVNASYQREKTICTKAAENGEHNLEAVVLQGTILACATLDSKAIYLLDLLNDLWEKKDAYLKRELEKTTLLRGVEEYEKKMAAKQTNFEGREGGKSDALVPTDLPRGAREYDYDSGGSGFIFPYQK